MKRTLLSLAVGTALGLSAAAYAAPVPSLVAINPDAAGGDPTVSVGTLDWAPGNALATVFDVESGRVTDPAVDDLFQIYAHARLGSFLDGDGVPIGGLALNGQNAATNYEWTLVTGFLEQVTGVGGIGPGASLNSVTVAGGSNFFEIWYDDTPDSNMRDGTGFNDGLRILTGTVAEGGNSSFTRNFAGTSPGPGGVGNALDQSADGNQYSGIDSINGGGNLTVNVTVTSFNPAYFTDPISALLLAFTTEQKLAFNQTNPSALFVTGPGGIAPSQAGATLASIGNCNGCFPGEGGDGVRSGPNEIFQSDPSNSFLVERIPEPGTIALLGLGLAGLGFSSRRRKLV
jgi:hypothetical protein